MATLKIDVTLVGRGRNNLPLSEGDGRLILSDVALSYELQLAISDLVSTYAEKRIDGMQALNVGVQAVVSPQ
jgi:hypothetical protein